MNLKFINKIDLDLRIRSLHLKEKNLLQEILWTIKEIDSRRMYLDFGYASLFLYLTQGVGYSEGSAQRRIDGARLLREIPEVSQLIQSGELQLSQVSMLQKASRLAFKKLNIKITSEQKKDLIQKLVQKKHSQLESQYVIASFFELPTLQDIRKTKQSDESVRLELTISKELFAKIEKAQQLLSHSVPTADLIKYLEYVTDKVIEAKTNIKPLATALNENKIKNRNLSKKADHRQMAALNAKNNRRSISTDTRKLIFNSNSYCQYKDPLTGKLCQSKWFLQIDHRQPKWANGANAFENLQILCSNHNRMKYLRETKTRLISS